MRFAISVFLPLIFFWTSTLVGQTNASSVAPAATLSAVPASEANKAPASPLVVDTSGAGKSPMQALDNNKVIAIGDVLSIRVIEDRKDPVVLLVDEQGMINMPLIGPVKARGLTCYQLACNIKQLLEKRYYYIATVLVSPAQNTGRGKVFILGQVTKQGPLEMPSNEVLTVSKAILDAGGMTPNADPIHVSIVRRDPTNPQKDNKIEVNVGAILNSGRLDLDVPVRPNDLIFVPARGESAGEIIVSGAVRSPGPYPIPIGTKFTTMDAIFRAGGFDQYADQSSIKIIRQDPKDPNKQRTIRVNLEAVLKKGQRDRDVEVLPGDVIVVPERFFNF